MQKIGLVKKYTKNNILTQSKNTLKEGIWNKYSMLQWVSLNCIWKVENPHTETSCKIVFPVASSSSFACDGKRGGHTDDSVGPQLKTWLFWTGSHAAVSASVYSTESLWSLNVKKEEPAEEILTKPHISSSSCCSSVFGWMPTLF